MHLFAHWLDQHETFRPVVAQLTQAVEAHHHTHPDEDFALLHHRESTLLRRFQALCFAPLFGIDRLPAFDTQEHPLATLLGRGYHHSTLSQFLGQLERVDAAEVLLPVLVPAHTGSSAQEQIPRSSLRFAMDLRSENFEGADVQGEGAFVSPRSKLRGRAFTYVDGHMIAYWSRMSMHKGKITMLGRIMAGSQAVIAHDDAGQALFVAYYPPDIHVSQVIVAYCQRVALATGRSMFVIDRAVNSVALAQAFDAQGLGLLCMLDDNEYAGVESFEAASVETREDGTRVYSGSWKEARADDPRHFVIVQAAEGKTLVYWGTPQVQDALEAKEWPGVYRERNEIQEHRFKDMIDHGALNINYGRKKMLGADRHHQRKQAQLAQSLETAHKRVEKKAAALKAQQDKVAVAVANGHGKRLEQRRRTLLTLEHECTEAKMTQAKCAEHVATLGPAGQRADRDFRKQTIMTIRTLFLENGLRTFIGALSALLSTKVSLPQVLSLLFERSGSRIETPSQVLYWVNSAGLSLSNRRLLSEVAQGLCAMGVQEQGKSVHVRLKDLPP